MILVAQWRLISFYILFLFGFEWEACIKSMYILRTPLYIPRWWQLKYFEHVHPYRMGDDPI